MAIADIAAYAHLSEADIEALGDELGVLDERRGVRDDAGDEQLAVGHSYVFPHAPLMLVARISAFEQ